MLDAIPSGSSEDPSKEPPQGNEQRMLQTFAFLIGGSDDTPFLESKLLEPPFLESELDPPQGDGHRKLLTFFSPKYPHVADVNKLYAEVRFTRNSYDRIADMTDW